MPKSHRASVHSKLCKLFFFRRGSVWLNCWNVLCFAESYLLSSFVQWTYYFVLLYFYVTDLWEQLVNEKKTVSEPLLPTESNCNTLIKNIQIQTFKGYICTNEKPFSFKLNLKRNLYKKFSYKYSKPYVKIARGGQTSKRRLVADAVSHSHSLAPE